MWDYRNEAMAEVTSGDEPECRREFEFVAIFSVDGENKAWSKATPILKLEMTVSNPNVDFKPGQEYYLDFVRVPRSG